jgi:hypothetical protein
MPKNPSQADHVVVIRAESALLHLETVLEDAFLECGSWFDKRLKAGEVKPPATLRFIDSNAQCFAEGLIRKNEQREQPEIRHFRQE